MQGLVKLADFGVASRLSEIATEDDPMAVAVAGTPYWMAPEVHHLLFFSESQAGLHAHRETLSSNTCVSWRSAERDGQ